MHVVLDWNTLLNTGILGLVAFSARQLWGIRLDIQSLIAWRDSHNKQDDERHDEMIERFDRMERTLTK